GESFAQGARRELREELGVDTAPQELFPFRYADEQTVVQAMVYKAVHNGPFQLQAEEIVSGEFVAMTDVKERLERPAFCPDGLKVFDEYEHRQRQALF